MREAAHHPATAVAAALPHRPAVLAPALLLLVLLLPHLLYRRPVQPNRLPCTRRAVPNISEYLFYGPLNSLYDM